METGKVCYFTGHGVISGAEAPALARRLRDTIEALISQGVLCFASGGASDFDQMGAHAVLAAREENPAVKLVMVLPCRDQDARRDEADALAYRCLLERADRVIWLAQSCRSGCMAGGNQYLARHGDICVAYLKRGRGGASQCVRLARECGAKVMNLAEA